MFNWLKKKEEPAAVVDVPEAINVEDLPHGSFGNNGIDTTWTGEKYQGGMGAPKLYEIDYWTLREYSRQLFYDNLYAKGLIKRLLTNVISTGLHLDCEPEESWLGLEEDSLVEWTERTETHFKLWGDRKNVDWSGKRTWGEIQQQVYLQAMVEGDVLVIFRQTGTGMLRLELVSGQLINTPLDVKIADGHEIRDGIEFDSTDREVAYWVLQKGDQNKYKRISARGRRSGRTTAVLIRGHESLLGNDRGEPLLGVVLQSIKELDRYREAAQRKAAINAILAMFVTKEKEVMGSKPLSGGAQRKDTTESVNSDGSTQTNRFNSQLPGLTIEEMQVGEKVVAHSTAGTDINLGDFEAAILSGIAWSNEMPPEILTLSFSSNYSASQAALQEFILFLKKKRTDFASPFNKIVYQEWVVTESLARRLDRAGDILTAWRTDELAWHAWTACNFTGVVKQSTDLLKAVKAAEISVNNAWSTNDEVTRALFGGNYNQNVKRLLKENQKKATMREPLMVETEEATVTDVKATLDDIMLAIEELKDTGETNE